MGEQVIVWPLQKVELLIKALDFCIERLAPMAKDSEIKSRRDQYVYIKGLVTKAMKTAKEGSISLSINEEAAALIKPAVVSYVAEVQKSAGK